jgi:hypothetical protein
MQRHKVCGSRVDNLIGLTRAALSSFTYGLYLRALPLREKNKRGPSGSQSSNRIEFQGIGSLATPRFAAALPR